MTDLWGLISATDWHATPCMVGRAATGTDVAAGSATFHEQGGSIPAPMSLPCCAVQILDDGSEQPISIVQAELAQQGAILGVRPLCGGNGICMSTYVRLLPAGFGSQVGA